LRTGGEVGGSEGCGEDAGPVAAVIERDPVAVREAVVAFDTELGVGANFAAGGDEIVVVDVADGAGEGARDLVVWEVGS